ncbi:MAG: ornithine acetyltransferase, partial [Thermodesulfatator sp.]
MRVPGFRASAVAAGIKYQNRPDLGIICCDKPAVTAAVFTRNLVKAAPVLDAMKLLENNSAFRAVVVNSGNANACTGSRGLEDCLVIRKEAARLLGCSPGQILVSSTGVIGAFLPMERFLSGLENAAEGLSEDGLPGVASAILTTDTRPKTATSRFSVDGYQIVLSGMAKGAGMIAPSMGLPQATMLSFVCCNAAVDPGFWQSALQEAVEHSFNRITVDGDMSTNDTVIAMASGVAGNPVEDGSGQLAEGLKKALSNLLMDLSRQIVKDGEGATKCVTVLVRGARDEADAELAARAISNSSLVKTAFFGQDPNWGRILAAAGRSGALFDPDRADIFIDQCQIVRQGAP